MKLLKMVFNPKNPRAIKQPAIATRNYGWCPFAFDVLVLSLEPAALLCFTDILSE